MVKYTKHIKTNWDYFDPSLAAKYPYISYKFHTEDTRIYTIKCLWTDTTCSTGLIYIMDHSDLPHQGKCINVWEIKDHYLKSGLFHTPDINDLRLFIQSYKHDFMEKPTINNLGSICNHNNMPIHTISDLSC